MTGITDMDYQGSIAAAVRAEFSRRGYKLVDLAGVIGRSRPTAADSWWGRRGYNTDELGKVALFLGISPYDLNDSAALGKRFADANPTQDEVARITPPQDPWAQPSRSKRRA
jgi:hypothetical protein